MGSPKPLPEFGTYWHHDLLGVLKVLDVWRARPAAGARPRTFVAYRVMVQRLQPARTVDLREWRRIELRLTEVGE